MGSPRGRPRPATTRQARVLDELGGIVKGAALVGAGLVGVVSGIAGLVMKDASRAGVAALRGIAAVCVLYVIVRLVHSLLIQEKRALERELDELRIQRTWYLGAVSRLVDRQTLLYEEELEVTVVVGDDDEGDQMIERHTTTPTPYLFYRSMRPIVPRGPLVPPNFQDLQVHVEVENGDGVIPTVLPIGEEGSFIRLLVIFEPPADHRLVWRLCYRPAGVWSALRHGGVDTLTWDARTPLGSRESTYTRLSIRFRYPQHVPVMRVRERGGRGTVRHDEARHEVVWSVDEPDGVVYEWDLTMPGPDRSPSRP